jgi:2-oxoglutarate dehydrogenase E1 component
VIGHFCERIFTSFEGSIHPSFPADEGDVKYHQGAAGERDTPSGKKVQLRLSPNPSHLEAVDPVVEGMTRATQDSMMNDQQLAREQVMDYALPVLLHGDAAFAGQGIVMETLQLAQLARLSHRRDDSHHSLTIKLALRLRRNQDARRFIRRTSPA